MAIEREQCAARGWAHVRAGNFVAALDAAREGLELWPDDLSLQHVAILALASCGSTSAALAMYQASPLGRSEVEDHAALGARLLKDLAWRSEPEVRNRLLLEAATRYEQIYRRTGGTYSAVNCATLLALAGEEREAVSLARELRRRLSHASPQPLPDLERYFHWATVAETAALLRDTELFERALTEADGLERKNLWVRARTYSQLARLNEIRPELRGYAERWHRPQIAFLTTGDHPDWAIRRSRSPDLTPDAALVFCAESPEITRSALHGFAADGASVHVLVEGMCGSWQHDDVAVDLSALHLDASQGSEDERHALCSQVALGVSIGSALAAGAPWSCLSVAAGRVTPLAVLDTADLEGALSAGECLPAGAAAKPETPACTRSVAVLFADAVGYSRFSAIQVQRYWSSLMPQVAAVVKRRAAHVLLRKTWGDALHAVVTNASAAADIAAALVQIAEQAWSAHADRTMPTFRVSLHFGLVDEGIDPVEEARSFFGPQMSLAARVELVAPPGGIYVTEAFAARLTLEGRTAFDCTYVGSVRLPKDYGELRLLALQPRPR